MIFWESLGRASRCFQRYADQRDFTKRRLIGFKLTVITLSVGFGERIALFARPFE